MRLHSDWPAVSPDSAGIESYTHVTPYSDLIESLDSGRTGTAEAPSTELDRISFEQVATVEKYAISYHGEDWRPGNYDGYAGTELNMTILGTLKDGRYFTVVAWNDYTGWGCQDDSVVRVGATRDDCIRYGLDTAARALLGLELPA